MHGSTGRGRLAAARAGSRRRSGRSVVVIRVVVIAVLMLVAADVVVDWRLFDGGHDDPVGRGPSGELLGRETAAVLPAVCRARAAALMKLAGKRRAAGLIGRGRHARAAGRDQVGRDDHAADERAAAFGNRQPGGHRAESAGWRRFSPKDNGDRSHPQGVGQANRHARHATEQFRSRVSNQASGLSIMRTTPCHPLPHPAPGILP